MSYHLLYMLLINCFCYRMTSRQYLLTQVTTICKIYQKLESNNRQFVDSPQRLHLTHTLSRLFEIMQNEDKIKLYHMFSLKEERNISLWVCLKLSNLSNDTQLDSEMATMEKLQVEMQRLTTDEYCSNIYELVSLISLLLYWLMPAASLACITDFGL